MPKSWITRNLNKLRKKLVGLLNQGLTPKELALSIAIGSFIGVLPLFGISTAIITLLAIGLRLNLPLAVFMTYAVSPIHLLMIIPFIRIGEYALGIEHSLITVTAIKDAFQNDYMQAISDLIFQLGCGLVGWIIVGIPFAYFIYVLLHHLFKLYHGKKLLSLI